MSKLSPKRLSQTALRKAAILVSTLDARSATVLLGRMGNEQAVHVRRAVSQLGDVSGDERRAVMAEFLKAGGLAPTEPDGGIELVDSLAHKLKTAAEPEASESSEEAGPTVAPRFGFLQEAPADALARHLHGEHPQIIAVVVAHLPPKRAADLIKQLPDLLQVDVLRRVAELDAADPHVLRDLEQELEELLSDEIRVTRIRSEGLSTVSSILSAAGHRRSDLWNNVSRHDRQLVSLLADGSVRAEKAGPVPAEESPAAEATTAGPAAGTPRKAGPGLAAKPTGSPLPQAAAEGSPAPPSSGVTIDFEDLIQLDDAALAILIQAVEPEVLCLALTGASETFLQRILGRLPGRERRALGRRLQRPGPLRLADIDQAQRRMADLAAQLVEQGILSPPPARRLAVAA